eukprot:jgi/Botrbrau1/20217/Bobra.31_1s0014.1
MLRIILIFFENMRGQRLYYRRYSPLEKEPVAALVFHHGYPSHLGLFDCQYCHLFSYLQQRGIAVFIYDAHGFGRSEPQDPRDRLFILSIQYLIDDFLTFREGVVGSYADSFKVPVFAAGISMEGLVSTLAVMESPKSWQAGPHPCVLTFLGSAHFLANSWGMCWSSATSPLVRHFESLSGSRPRRLRWGWLGPQQEFMSRDPLVPFRKLRVATAFSLLDGFARIKKGQDDVQVPVFLAHPTEDKAVSQEAMVNFVEAVRAAEKVEIEYKVYEGAPHLITHWPLCRDQLATDIADWVLSGSRNSD